MTQLSGALARGAVNRGKLFEDQGEVLDLDVDA
jgi:hypothetical protein